MKIHFGLQFDQVTFHQFGISQDFENRVLGPLGLVSFYQTLIGDFKPESTKVDRVLEYENLIKKEINSYPELENSFITDSFNFSAKLLEIRDWLKINDLVHHQWPRDNVRFHLIENVENVGKVSSGFADNYSTIKSSFLEATEKNNIEFILYGSLSQFPFYIISLFKCLSSELITEFQNVKDLEGDKKVFLKALQGEGYSSFQHFDDLSFIKLADEEEAIKFIGAISQNDNNVIVGDGFPNSIDSYLYSLDGNTLGFKTEFNLDYWKQLPELLLCLLEKNIDVFKFYQLLESKYSIFGESAKLIRSALNKSLSFDIENWLIQWSNNPSIDFDEIKVPVDKWLNNRFFLIEEGEEIKSKDLINFYNEVIKDLEDYFFSDNSLINFNDFKFSIIKLISILEKESSISKGRLIKIIRLISEEKVNWSYEQKTDTSFWVNDPRQILCVEKVKKRCFFIVNGDINLLDNMSKTLFDSEKKTLGAINSEIVNFNYVADWISGVIRMMSICEELVIVNVEALNGEENEKPFLIELLSKLKISTLEKGWDEFVQSSTSLNIPLLSGIKVVDEWDLSKISSIFHLPEVESYSSLSGLIEYPHSYVLSKCLGVYKKGYPGFDEIAAAKGILAHAVIEKLVNERKIDASSNEISILTRQLIEEKASILNLRKYKLEAREVESSLLVAIPYLNNIIKNLNFNNLKVEMEKKVQKLVLGIESEVKGYIDMVLFDGDKPVGVLDIKYSGYNTRYSDLTRGADYQLAMYNRLLGRDDLPKGFFLVKEAKLLTNHDSFFGSKAMVVSSNSKVETQILEFIDSVNIRKKEIKNGKVEISFNEKLDNIPFWKEVAIKPNHYWGKKKGYNPFDNYSNLLG